MKLIFLELNYHAIKFRPMNRKEEQNNKQFQTYIKMNTFPKIPVFLHQRVALFNGKKGFSTPSYYFHD